MEYLVAGLVVLGFGYFIYRKVKAKKSSGTTVGGGSGGGSGENTQQH